MIITRVWKVGPPVRRCGNYLLYSFKYYDQELVGGSHRVTLIISLES